MECTASPNVVLQPHQIRVANKALNARGLLVCHSTGSGKTLTAAACAKCVTKRFGLKHVVVLARKSATDQFMREIVRFWPECKVSVECTTHQTFFGPTGSAWKGANEPESTFLVVDEAHEFTTPKTRALRHLADYCARCNHMIFLTATPIVNDIYDIGVLASVLKGMREPVSKQEFAVDNRRFVERFMRGIVDLHIVDKDRDPRYPALKRQKVSIPMSRETRREHDRLNRDHSLHKPFYMHLRQITLGMKCEKCAWLMENVSKWISRGEGKVLVYCQFLEDNGAHRLQSMFLQSGINCMIIDGSASTKRRSKTAAFFSRKPEDEQREQESKRDLRDLVVDNTSGKSGTRCGEGNVLARRTTDPKTMKMKCVVPAAGGRKCNASEEAFVESLRIPPMWTPAEVCKTKNERRETKANKLVWTAMDKRGKWQYRYSDDWATQQEYAKILKLKGMDAAFWKRFDGIVDADLRKPGWSSERKLLALATRLMQTCVFRVGGRLDSDSNDDHQLHFGLMTCTSGHVSPNGSKIQFVGKSGKANSCEVRSAQLRSMLATLARSTKNKRSPLFGSVANAEHLRRYLAEIQPGLTPKDFRTHFANVTLLSALLSAQPPAVSMTMSQRAKVLKAAIEQVARGLNNTPRVAKSSYVFSGFYALYLVDPVKFNALVRRARSPNVHDVMASMVEGFEEESVDWQHMLKWYRENRSGGSEMYGPANVLIITDAGAESIDLVGVRHIVFVDAVWTPAMEDQIVGRGRRLNSHMHLPASERTVTVWKLHLVDPAKPAGSKSVEQVLEDVVDAKRKSQDAFMSRLVKASSSSSSS